MIHITQIRTQHAAPTIIIIRINQFRIHRQSSVVIHHNRELKFTPHATIGDYDSHYDSHYTNSPKSTVAVHRPHPGTQHAQLSAIMIPIMIGRTQHAAPTIIIIRINPFRSHRQSSVVIHHRELKFIIICAKSLQHPVFPGGHPSKY